jgi:hypothetical protein
MREFLAVRVEGGAWPAGCLFIRQPDATGFGKLGRRVGSFQEVGKKDGKRPTRSGNRERRADKNGRKGKRPGAPGYDL